MKPRRERTILTDASRPAMPPHVRIQYCQVRRAWAVLAPEKVYWPDETSLAILRRCDGTVPLGVIVTELAGEYGVPVADIRGDIVEFVQDHVDSHLLECAAGDP